MFFRMGLVVAEVFELGISSADIRLSGCVCAIGVFDGIHLGHKAIINKALEDAKARKVPCVIVTFSVDPDEIFKGENFRKIMSNTQRISALSETGADKVAVLMFERDMACKSPEEFLDAVFSNAAVVAIHVGCDFRFGKAAAGTVADLRKWAAEYDVSICAHDLLTFGGVRISSTRIRGLLEDGNVVCARELLGHPYTLEGNIVRGREAGREMGIRTANLKIPTNMRVLGSGVYAAYAVLDKKRYKAAVSVGISPTFEDIAESNIEAHILDFDGDIYGKELTLEFIDYIRPMQRFDSVDRLVATIKHDISYVKKSL